MDIKENKIIKNLWIAFLIVAIFWPLAFINKGIDLTDTGYYLANYANILKMPEKYGMGTFLSNYFGGLLYSVMPTHQLMFFKFLNVVFYGISILLTFYALKKYFDKNILSFLIMIGSFSLSEYPQCVSYNTFSVVFLSLSMFMLVKWTEKHQKRYLALCGFATGISVLFRIPNLLFGALYFAVLWYDIIADRKKETLKDTLSMAAGGVAGILVGLGMTVYFIGISSFSKGVGSYTNMGGSSSGSHSLIGNLKGLCYQLIKGVYEHAYFVAVSIILFSILAVLIYKYKKLSKNRFAVMSIVTIFIICIASAVLNSIKFDDHLKQTEMLAVMAFPAFIASAFYYRKKNPDLSMLSVAIFVIAAFIPIGTNNGFKHYSIALFWVLPCAILIACELIKEYYTGEITVFKAVVLSLCIVVTSNVLANNVFRSTKNMCTVQYLEEPYNKLKYSPNNEVLAGVYTTEQRCFLIDKITEFMSDSQMRSKKLLVLNRAPMFYAMLGNDNVLDASFWPDQDTYSIEKLKAKLQYAEDNNDLPVVIIYHISDTGLPILEDTEKVAYIKEFCEERNYTVADEASFEGEKQYTILVP